MNRSEQPPHDPALLADALGLLQADADLRDRRPEPARCTIEANVAVERNAGEVVTLFQRGGGGR